MEQSSHNPSTLSSLVPDRRTVLKGLAASALVGQGTVPAVAAKPLKAERFSPPQVGSTWAYALSDGRMECLKRIDNSHWGNIPIVRYRRDIEGEPSEIRSYNARLGTWVVTFGADEIAIVAAEPDDRRYRWPMARRGYWRSQYKVRDLKGERNLTAYASWRVDGFERVAIPDGTTKAIRLHSDIKERESMVWYAWDMGIRTRVQHLKDGEIVRDKTLVRFSPA